MRDYVELTKGGSRVQLYRCVGRLFQERRSRLTNPNPQGPPTNTQCRDNKERDRTFDERLRALLAQGWVDRNPPPAATRAKKYAKPEPVASELALAALAKRTIAELGKATEADDGAIWRRAIAAYGKLKVRAGGDRTEHLVHFFAVDGIALDTRHPVVVSRARASKARKARWIAILEAAR